MKIIFVSTGISKNEDYINGYLGGIEKQILGISKELSELGHDVFIIRKFNCPLKSEAFNKITLINVHSLINFDDDLRSSLISAFFSRLLFSKKASEKIDEIKPDIIFVSEKISAYFISKLTYWKIFVVHMPPYELIKQNFSINIIERFVYYFLERFESSFLKRFNGIISLNSSLNQYFLNKGYNSIFIPNGINIEEYNPESDNHYILYGGRLIPEKGILYLLQAYYELKKNNLINLKLFIVGSGPFEHILRKYVNFHGLNDLVEFTPWLNNFEFKRKIEKCTIFVLPSLFECMPVSILEAMACAKPVIASDIPGPQDVICHGINGYLFEKGNIHDLKKFLLLLDNDNLRKNIGKNARFTIEKKYAFQLIAKEYSNYLNHLNLLKDDNL